LVDPAFTAAQGGSRTSPGNESSPSGEAKARIVTPNGIELDEAASTSLEDCLILQGKTAYSDSASLWKAQDWGTTEALGAASHRSWPYHNGCSTLAPLMFSQIGIGAKEANIKIFQDKRNHGSALDEMVFYWTKLAPPSLLKETSDKSSNAAYYLLKHVAQHWINHLELMNTTISKAEWFSDDYQAQIDDKLSRQKWKAELLKINNIAKDINYMRRHLNHFWRAMYLNLERLGVQLGAESIDENASLALKGAQKDFLTIHTRMQPLRDRAEALNSVSNDLANLRAAFRGVSDGEFSLRLSLFASIVFPLTLLAGIFSMGDDFRPGRPQFWKLWAIGVPFCMTVALGLVYGRRPWRVFFDLKEYVRVRLRSWGFLMASEEKAVYEQKRRERKGRKVVGRGTGPVSPVQRVAWKNGDEELGITSAADVK
jgi:hypothetical protein